MKIYFSEYELHPYGSLNAQRIQQPKRGALIKVEEADRIGYADLCPLTEFGDSGIERQLESLLTKKPKKLAARSLFLAQKDAEARHLGHNLYGKELIRNHFLINEILEFDINSLATLVIQGYHTFKIKLGRDIYLEGLMLQEVLQKLSSENLENIKVRLDFNETQSEESFTQFLESLNKKERKYIEFVEDPFSYSAEAWQSIQNKFGVSLAADLSSEAIESEGVGFDVLVIKPARIDPFDLVEKFPNKSVVVTHSQDFVVGQLHALAEAYELQRKGVNLLTCGLQMLNTFEPTEFGECLKTKGDCILPPQGEGIGLEEELVSEKWTELV